LVCYLTKQQYAKAFYKIPENESENDLFNVKKVLTDESLNDYMLWTITLTKGVDKSVININGPHGKNILIESSDQYDFFLNSLLQVLDTNNLRLFHWLDKYSLSNWGIVKEN
jgi:hypothetical protein